MATRRDPAPGPLELVRAFVNTYDVESGADRLATPEALREWMGERGLLDADPITEADRRRTAEVREALRSLLLGNTGEPLDTTSVAVLNRAAADARLVLGFHADGRSDLEPDARGVDRALGSLLATVFTSMVDGSWERLKACLNDECRWAFYDHSKNRSGKWCTMAVCGNRMKARAYRERHAEPAPRPASPRRETA
ncbi:MAG: CGNR zinc finger domain-containing protein [Acidimicrobiia bacterium]